MTIDLSDLLPKEGRELEGLGAKELDEMQRWRDERAARAAQAELVHDVIRKPDTA